MQGCSRTGLPATQRSRSACRAGPRWISHLLCRYVAPICPGRKAVRAAAGGVVAGAVPHRGRRLFTVYAGREKGIREAGAHGKGAVRRLVLCVSGASAGSACAGPCWLFNQLLPPSRFGPIPYAAVPPWKLLHLFDFKKDPMGQPLAHLICTAFADEKHRMQKKGLSLSETAPLN